MSKLREIRSREIGIRLDAAKMAAQTVTTGRRGKLRAFTEGFLRELSPFPSPALEQELRALGKITATASRYQGASVERILTDANDGLRYPDGITIDIGHVSQASRELQNLRLAQERDPKHVRLIGTSSNFNEPFERLSLEDRLQRQVVEEMLANPLARTAVKSFFWSMLVDYPHLVVKEWNRFIAGHDESKDVISADETHHHHNVGIRKLSEGEDPLRDRLDAFIMDVMHEFGPEALKVFYGVYGKLQNHAIVQNEGIEGFFRALGWAEISNAMRAIALRPRRGDKYLDDWQPRRIAADIFDQANEFYFPNPS